MKLLLHCCCAPCSAAVIAALREEGIEPALFWYNPNIHPFTEYQSRRDTLVRYAQELTLPLVMEDEYGLRLFLRSLGEEVSVFDVSRRCGICYRLRMEKTAAAAREQGFDAFSTTLFVSPYQDHERLVQTAETAAKQEGTALLYRDFRPRFREGQRSAWALGLYMQKYCGCIFSEEERFSLAQDI